MSVQSSSQDQRAVKLRDRILAERHRMMDSAGRRLRRDTGIRPPLDRSRLPLIRRGRRPTLG